MGITIVIVISFSFFGTYSVFLKGEKKDGVAFTAIDGSKVYTGQLHDLISLISGDSRDLLLRNGPATAFNDGFVAKDILATGVAQVLVEPVLSTLQKEFSMRLEKEKHFVPFAHKMNPFINAEQVWTYFAPDVKKYYTLLKSYDDPANAATFDARVKLYLAERNFPAPYMRQVLRYQLSQFEDPSQDEELASRDFALFGYHTLQDWFSKEFVELVAQYVINVAKLAEQKGYSVTTQEVLWSLSNNIQASFKENRNNPYFTFSTQDLYFQEELRRQNMDLARLVAAWKNVELYRRFMGQNKDALLISPLPFRDFTQYLEEEVEAETYHLPKELCFHNLRDIEKFELYLNAIRDPKEKCGLMMPKKLLSADEVMKVFPEFVEKRYRLRYWLCDKEVLKTKIGVKATWEWQIEDKGWKKLQEKFPDIGAKKTLSKEERCGVLDTLDSKTRNIVDSFSRDVIVDEHPEWIQETLGKAVPKEEDLFLRERGGKSPFVGISRPSELFRLLDSASLGEPHPALSSYSQDGVHYWKIVVLDRQEAPKILTFREANVDGTLDQVLDKILEASYSRIRSSHPAAYVKENGEFRDFKEVRDLVGEAYFQELFVKLDKQKDATVEEMAGIGKDSSKDSLRLAARFFPYMKEAYLAVREQSPNVGDYISSSKKDIVQPLLDQWKLIKGKDQLVRKGTNEAIFSPLAFSLDIGKFSKLCWMGKNGISFFKVIARTKQYEGDLLRHKVYDSREILQNEFIRGLTRELSTKMREKRAFGSFTE
jgi:GcvH upstream region-like protein